MCAYDQRESRVSTKEVISHCVSERSLLSPDTPQPDALPLSHCGTDQAHRLGVQARGEVCHVRGRAECGRGGARECRSGFGRRPSSQSASSRPSRSRAAGHGRSRRGVKRCRACRERRGGAAGRGSLRAAGLLRRVGLLRIGPSTIHLVRRPAAPFTEERTDSCGPFCTPSTGAHCLSGTPTGP